MLEQAPGANRRQFPRFNAPLCYRAAPFFATLQAAVNVGLGGIRIYSDEPLKIGKRLEIELLLPEDESLKLTARVAWQTVLPAGACARYDVGLEFLHVSAAQFQRLQELLAQCTAQEGTDEP